MTVPQGQPGSTSSAAKPAPPCTFVIFGARGDLTRRLLIPSIYNLVRDGLLDDGMRLIGVDHNELSTDDWRKLLSGTLDELAADPHAEFHAGKVDPKIWKWITDRMEYVTADFDDDKTYKQLGDHVKGSAVFYLAVSARFFGPIVEHLGKAGLLAQASGGSEFRRVIIEKPFGSDLQSAIELNKRILAVGDESQFFRIDHFLGKDAVQSLLAMRFANRLFEPAWRAGSIDHVQITAAETIGVGSRGNFYETTGALRDMVPNHLFQLLTMAGMEAPKTLDANAVRDEKTKLVKAIEAVRVEDVVRGQYTSGEIDGEAAKGYVEEDNVAKDSTTETYVALKFSIDTPRWKGVPFYLRTGKRMGGRFTEIAIHFKPEPFGLFEQGSAGEAGYGPSGDCHPAQGTRATLGGKHVSGPAPNVLTIHIDPTHGAALRFNVKVPGPLATLGEVEAVFDFDKSFGDTATVGYESLVYECLLGDATLFQRADTIEASWAAVQPAIDLATQHARPEPYRAGSAGPASADALLGRDGRTWTPMKSG